MAEIVMPRLSDTMEEGTILRWLKREGEQVARGEELVEIETDKATMVYESDAAGALQIVAEEGATLPVGGLIAHVGVDGPASVGPAEDAAPAAATEPGGGDGADGGRAVANGAASGQQEAERPAAIPGDGAAVGEGERIKASPLARRLARERGIELQALHGSGPGGRIVRADVEAAPSAPATVAGVGTAKGETTTEPLTRTQQTIARRMAESKATIPDFSIIVEVEMEACVELRAELKRLGGDPVPTYNDMVVKACALALREHPRVNGSYRDGVLQLHSRVNVGVAVAAENALVVPTVFDADLKALGEVARETRALAERVRDGTITPPELGGGTFTVSNLGMYGVRSFSAIINPPQAAIMSVGALERRAVVVEDGTLAARNVLALTLVCDHRILYGADAAEFAARVRELLEAPAALSL
ncbi:MAG TPA: dihydrolipoamide acetyltransferase family protein [Solirubrobacteraceae bacterium]|jgi:pyruvate dehydrogenase E2 component (dihydrolipoamide acetyltransferase)|nr:dihydrolipoamide acetyltransferase family protein [Solirubrobacteraceae bacterium]